MLRAFVFDGTRVFCIDHLEAGDAVSPGAPGSLHVIAVWRFPDDLLAGKAEHNLGLNADFIRPHLDLEYARLAPVAGCDALRPVRPPTVPPEPVAFAPPEEYERCSTRRQWQLEEDR